LRPHGPLTHSSMSAPASSAFGPELPPKAQVHLVRQRGPAPDNTLSGCSERPRGPFSSVGNQLLAHFAEKALRSLPDRARQELKLYFRRHPDKVFQVGTVCSGSDAPCLVLEAIGEGARTLRFPEFVPDRVPPPHQIPNPSESLPSTNNNRGAVDPAGVNPAGGLP